jgi:peptidyl-prolyl cis-trans isomerase B (cyclophilin B)
MQIGKNIGRLLMVIGVMGGMMVQADEATTNTAGPALTPKPAQSKNEAIMILIKTSMGDIKAELDAEKAPLTVNNFMQYVDDHYYDGTIFHRVIAGFMIQGGGFDGKFIQKQTRAPIKNEAGNGLKNVRGTLAMARTSEVNSGTSQFFINTVDNPFLDHSVPTPQGFGYCVFGKVVEGMDVVDHIRNVQTGGKGPFPSDVPLATVTILSITRL